ncbi:tyrosine-type recombinase/integrase [Acidobacteria bacterium AH-259-G07]|nr:tyrosine-type recombinase/integrase [Acidobacteria bacterium AH-259-G07]
MSELRQAVEEYLAIRRSLGFKLRRMSGALPNFVAFVEQAGSSYITRELALQWAKRPGSAQPATWARRLGMVRSFALWRSTTDPRTEVPPEDLLRHPYRRKSPYIYTDQEIDRIIQAARELPSSKGLRALTYSTLFGLLAVTGMRVSEALNLDRKHVDLERGILTIQHTKFDKSRLLPVHPSTIDALKTYANRRDKILPAALVRSFFVSEQGRRITDSSTRYTFAKVSRQIGLRAPVRGYQPGRGPRLHDLRHRFAVGGLIAWYRAGLDVERELPKLSTYLGHVHVNDTYWYLEAVPELLQMATERLMDREKEGES